MSNSQPAGGFKRQSDFDNDQYRHDAEIGELRARQENIQLQMAEIIGKLNVIIEQGTQQLLKIALLEQETKQHWREIESVNKEIDTFKRDVALEVVEVKAAHTKLDKTVHRYLYIGTGLWLAFVAICWIIGDKPLKSVENLVDRVATHEKRLDDIKDAVFELQQNQTIAKRVK